MPATLNECMAASFVLNRPQRGREVPPFAPRLSRTSRALLARRSPLPNYPAPLSRAHQTERGQKSVLAISSAASQSRQRPFSVRISVKTSSNTGRQNRICMIVRLQYGSTSSN